MLEEITANGDGINLSLQGQIDEPLEAGAQRLPGLRPRPAACRQAAEGPVEMQISEVQNPEQRRPP
jgi:hypothetical protein